MAKGKYQKWLEPESLILIEGWARNGLTDEQIAHNMGIRRETLWAWKAKFPNLDNALKRNREVVDMIVENSLFRSAIGHTVKVKKPIKLKTEKQKVGEGKIVEERVEMVETEVYIQPNVTAQIFWLKNRANNKWNDRPEMLEYIDARTEEVDARTRKLIGNSYEVEDVSEAEALIYGGESHAEEAQATQND